MHYFQFYGHELITTVCFFSSVVKLFPFTLDNVHVFVWLLLLLLLSHFSRVWLCATTYMGAHQAPLSLWFCRQEHWSGLPFPSPIQESEKWKWSHSVVSDSCDPMDHSLPGSSVHGIFPGKSAGVGCHCLLWLKYIVTHQNSSLHCDSALSCKRMEIILKTGTLLKNTPTCSISRLSPFLCVSLYCRWIIFSKPI